MTGDDVLPLAYGVLGTFDGFFIPFSLVWAQWIGESWQPIKKQGINGKAEVDWLSGLACWAFLWREAAELDFYFYLVSL